MSHNPVENYFLGEAIKALRPRYEGVYGRYPGHFDLNRIGLRFLLIEDGPDKGKLTVAKSIDGVLIPDPRIVPVDCYNLIKPDESLAEAVSRVLSEKRTPSEELSSVQ